MAVDEGPEPDPLDGARHPEPAPLAPAPPRRPPSADAGQGIADEHVDDAGAAEGGQQHDDARRVVPDLTDARGVGAERMGAQGIEGGVGLVRSRPRR